MTQDSTIQNFLGNTNMQGYDPPDTYGQVGPNDYFALVNCHFSIYDKNGSLLLGPVSTETIWSGMPSNMNGGDGIVLYDAQADRWLIAQLSYPSSSVNLEMIAVSQTSDPTGSWYRWEYSFGSDLPDYPKMGVWPDGYYLAVNRFAEPSGSYQGTEQAVFDRTGMLAGNSSAQMVSFTLPSSNSAFGLLPSTCDGAFPASGTPNYFTYIGSTNYLGIYEFHVDWNTPANSTFGNFLQLPVTTFNKSISNIPQKGTNRLAEVLSDRLMYRSQFRVFNDHWSMVTNHTVNAGSNIAGIRWYELRKTTGNWSVYQQSTYAPDSNYRWMGSIAMDSVGNIALGFSISSSSMYPAIKYTGRLKSDPLNVMDISEKGIFYGTGSNTANDGSGYCRWGDYSSMTVDPSDGMTFWYSQQYNTSMGSDWQTRIASFNFKDILSVLVTATPDTICTGDSTQLNVTATGGSGTYTYSWTSIPSGFTSNIKNPMASPTITTSYIIAVIDSSGSSVTDTITITVNGKATANAGSNASYPNTIPLFPVSGTATNYSSVMWLTAGDGYFNIDTVLNSIYYPGTNDRHYGGVLLSLQAYPITPCSDTAIDTVFITLTFPLGGATVATVPFDVNIVPNPTTGIFNLVVHGVSDMDLMIMITDLEGKTIFVDQDRPQSQEYTKVIDIASFPKGVYLVKVKTDIQTITKELVIQ